MDSGLRLLISMIISICILSWVVLILNNEQPTIPTTSCDVKIQSGADIHSFSNVAKENIVTSNDFFSNKITGVELRLSDNEQVHFSKIDSLVIKCL